MGAVKRTGAHAPAGARCVRVVRSGDSTARRAGAAWQFLRHCVVSSLTSTRFTPFDSFIFRSALLASVIRASSSRPRGVSAGAASGVPPLTGKGHIRRDAPPVEHDRHVAVDVDESVLRHARSDLRTEIPARSPVQTVNAMDHSRFRVRESLAQRLRERDASLSRYRATPATCLSRCRRSAALGERTNSLDQRDQRYVRRQQRVAPLRRSAAGSVRRGAGLFSREGAEIVWVC
jgi:hypothetical protein